MKTIRNDTHIMLVEETAEIKEGDYCYHNYGRSWRSRGLSSNGENQWTEEDLKPFK